MTDAQKLVGIRKAVEIAKRNDGEYYWAALLCIEMLLDTETTDE